MHRRRETQTGLLGKREWKKPLGRPTHIWEDNNRIDFKEIGLELSEVMLLRTGTSEMKYGYLQNIGQERKILYIMKQVTKAIQY